MATAKSLAIQIVHAISPTATDKEFDNLLIAAEGVLLTALRQLIYEIVQSGEAHRASLITKSAILDVDSNGKADLGILTKGEDKILLDVPFFSIHSSALPTDKQLHWTADRNLLEFFPLEQTEDFPIYAVEGNILYTKSSVSLAGSTLTITVYFMPTLATLDTALEADLVYKAVQILTGSKKSNG